MNRINVIQILILAATLIIIFRLFYWQFLSDISSGSDVFLLENEIPAPRGNILDTQNYPLVLNQEAFLIYAKPKELDRDPVEVAKLLAPYLISEKYATQGADFSDEEIGQKEKEIDDKVQDIENSIRNPSLYWVQVARKIPKEIKEKIEKLNIKGLGFEIDPKRYYPEASMAAQLLGFVGSDKLGRDTGYFGIEGFWDKKLKGSTGNLGQEQDPLGLPILVGNYRRVEPKKGQNIKLSVDRFVQSIVEKNLEKSMESYGAKFGSVIVSDPKTGNIISMATYPNYNPSLRLEYDDQLYKNPVVADSFEPGSIFKPLVMAAALDIGVVKPDTFCEICDGPRKISGFEISTWNNKYHPNSNMIDVIKNSDNVGMTFVADKLGKDQLYEYISAFGFGNRTNIDLQEESPGFIRERNEWKDIDLATASFGQGIAVTSVQIIQAFSALANGGDLISPRVANIVYNNGKEEKIETKKKTKVVTQKTASQITEMMVNAVKNGEAKYYAPTGYRIAGKTGTAQIPVAGHYDPEKTIASFVGFAPADDPKFVMLVSFTEPTSSPYGSETAAPTFFNITQDLFNYYGIPPTE